MSWFPTLRTALSDIYTAQYDDDIVGYLRGSSDPAVWRAMEASSHSAAQMIILGNAPPTALDWQDAGVAARVGEDVCVRIDMLTGLIVLFEGFRGDKYRRFGSIYTIDDDALRTFNSKIVALRQSGRTR